VPDKVARDSHYKVEQAAPIAKIDDLAAYDAIIIGAGTRFGRLVGARYQGRKIAEIANKLHG
jgi:hypothetical protein